MRAGTDPVCVIDQHIRQLDRALSGPAGLKRRMLTEARHGLDDAAADLRAAGRSPVEAEREAVAEFGSVGQLFPSYQAELAACAARALGLRVVAVFAVLAICADLMWRGAPWSGPRPSAAYLFLSNGIDVLGEIAIGLAVAGSAALWLVTRKGRMVPPLVLRVWIVAVVGVTASTGLAGLAIYGWSAEMWSGALTWPPMLVGGAAMAAAGVWVGRAASAGLGASSALRPGNGRPSS